MVEFAFKFNQNQNYKSDLAIQLIVPINKSQSEIINCTITWIIIANNLFCSVYLHLYYILKNI